ncbi:uncharacterized protein LOC132746556 isoform X2 [Ruditapes philippinarum]|uniref:uncharacterized protein LOC132746556 isoform X2 n=1 Tax=Ruditapes philippinarum TaxID=129788 RepID=UPI00295B51A0|nr:uncharacterized protein LOC132746556 isoform X2 [Ruditapes philippinarum]
MGICLSVPESNISDRDETENDWDSHSDDEVAENGTTASASDVSRDGEDGAMSPRNSATQENATSKVTFKTESHEKNVLREIFSEESLLEKSRKSFNADMRMFAIMFEESHITDKDRRNPK